MATTAISSIIFLLILLLSPIPSFQLEPEDDPELQQCQHQCRVQQQFDEWQKRACEHRCEDYAWEKQQRRDEERTRGRERKRGGDAEEERQWCRDKCHRRGRYGEGLQGECEERCLRKFGRRHDGDGMMMFPELRGV